MNIRRKEKGFTIIEVVLVLAIAGLIFMMVFLALPALQRSQRDTQRKNDLSRAMTAITSYVSNNRGAVHPVAVVNSTFKASYLTVSNDSFIDPSGAGSSNTTASSYDFNTAAAASGTLSAGFSTATQNIIYYKISVVCNATGGDQVPTAAGASKVTIRIYLEGGGVYCLNN